MSTSGDCMLTMRLDKELDGAPRQPSQENQTFKNTLAKESIRLYLDEREDYEAALSRLQNQAGKTISSKKMGKRLSP